MSDQRFDPATADEALFGDLSKILESDKPSDGIAHIGGREIEVRPLNLAGIRALWGLVLKILRPLFEARIQYNRDVLAYVEKREAGDATAMPPFPQWYLDVVDSKFEDVYHAVLIVLQRTDPNITMDWLKENLEPLNFLQEFVPIIIEKNGLQSLLKKALSSEMGRSLAANLATKPPQADPSDSQNPSESAISQSTSPGITESNFTDLPHEVVSTRSSSV